MVFSHEHQGKGIVRSLDTDNCSLGRFRQHSLCGSILLCSTSTVIELCGVLGCLAQKIDPILIKIIALFLVALDYCFSRETNSSLHLVPQKSVSAFNIRYRKQTGQTQVMLKSLIIVQLNKDQK